jgi:hypothetical protein
MEARSETESIIYKFILNIIEVLEQKSELPPELRHLQIEALNYDLFDLYGLHRFLHDSALLASDSATALNAFTPVWNNYVELINVHANFSTNPELSINLTSFSSFSIGREIANEIMGYTAIIIMNSNKEFADKYIPEGLVESILNKLEILFLETGITSVQAAYYMVMLEYIGETKKAKEIATQIAKFFSKKHEDNIDWEILQSRGQIEKLREVISRLIEN